jgi:hypothetical protein
MQQMYGDLTAHPVLMIDEMWDLSRICRCTQTMRKHNLLSVSVCKPAAAGASDHRAALER